MATIDVVAAIIEKDGQFLIAKRGKGKHMEGKWEFPGGKIERNETPEICLKRELQEELGIETRILDFVGESIFNYGEKEVRLLGYRASYIQGEFTLNDHDEIKWITTDEFNSYDFCEADIPLTRIIVNRDLSPIK